MPAGGSPYALPARRSLRYDDMLHVGDILVIMPAGPRFPEIILNKVDAFLHSRFPDERFMLAPGTPDGDQGFMVRPKAAAQRGVTGLELSFAVAARMNEIADTLEDFRAAGWSRTLH